MRRAPKSRGLVLAGGLFRCAFQVGVLEALGERDYRPDVVVGVSSGAWNAACWVAGQIDQMRGFWLRVAETPKVSLRNLAFNRTLFNLRWMVHQIPWRSLDFERIRTSETKLFVGVTKLPDFRARALLGNQGSREEIFSILMASNLVPVLYSWPVRIDGTYYLDGGLTDNVPYEVAFAAGCDEVLAVVPNHDGRILKKLQHIWGKGHSVADRYRQRLRIVAPGRPLHPLCASKKQIEHAMDEGYRIGLEVPLGS